MPGGGPRNASDTRGVGIRRGDEVYLTNKVAVGSMPTYAVSNVTTARGYDAAFTTTAQLADVLGTLIADLKNQGLIK